MARAVFVGAKVGVSVWRGEVRLAVARPDGGISLAVQLRPQEAARLLRDLVETLAFIDSQHAADTLTSAVDVLTGVTALQKENS
ncbi:hypothetical protein QEN42_07650 [Gordonia alkanivorans]|uniref:hypothetical protein n=1 Tax=Gordonia alkanivorans TaxID=84096 RepID=UPI002449A85A|nr:hypothetical protein [Gordonia alkanivorans]MDH3049749.1 hypothetical protein [Gordonia alkanivorans]